MDDSYWEALLLDAEVEAEPFVPKQRHSNWYAAQHAPPDALGKSNPDASVSAGQAAHDQETDWQRAEAMLASGETLDVLITGHNRGGVLSNFDSIQAFIPASHLLSPPIAQNQGDRMAALATRAGETLTVCVAEIDRSRRRLILSERLAGEEDLADEVLERLQSGQACRGTVTNLCPFGAFVDLGGFEGLIHISELSWGRVGSPSEVVEPGDEVEVLVLEVHPAEQKVALSLKQLRPDPWQGVEERYQCGQMLDAVITNVVSFGAFARLEEGLEGLIHISELAEGSFMHPRNIVREGEEVRVRVLQVNGHKHRLALTMRCANEIVKER
jgi:small subunit ribosomal protein S1